MISIVTLAHRVSIIHKKYAGIHSSVFSFSISQLKLSFWKGKEPEYCTYESELAQLCRELEEARALIDSKEDLEPANTVSREFAFSLDVYIIALSDAVRELSEICGHRCREAKGLEPYDAKQERANRHDYDNSIQQYRRLGERLNLLFKKL
ncbi:MAG: hypothetical protein GY792_28430 [Gammaproteobacteria bacterium]|nr:hypothetical protein [Gammaproteobacteria bacterium]